MPPARVADDALGEAPIPRQIGDIGDPQVLQMTVQIDRDVVSEQLQCRLVVKVPPLALHVLMRFAQLAHRLPTLFAALLAAAHALVGFGEFLFTAPGVAWVVHDQPIGGDEKHLRAHVYARLVSWEAGKPTARGHLVRLHPANEGMIRCAAGISRL